MNRSGTRNMVLIALFSAIIAVFSQLTIPSPTGIPFTLQTFIIALTAFVLGSAKGAASVCVYIAVGAVGLPVFTGFQGGLGALFGPTGGFIFGFIPMVVLGGIKTERRNFKLIFALSGVIICHLCGVLWFALYTKDITNAFLMASAPYIVKDIISTVLAMPASKKIMSIIQKFN